MQQTPGFLKSFYARNQGVRNGVKVTAYVQAGSLAGRICAVLGVEARRSLERAPSYCNGSQWARRIDDRFVGSVMVDVDVTEWSAELDRLHGRFAHRFTRSEPRRRARQYLSGLVAGSDRKNGWTLAEQAGDTCPDGMQRLLRWADWDVDAVRDDVRDYVVEHLHDPQAVLIIDDTPEAATPKAPRPRSTTPRPSLGAGSTGYVGELERRWLPTFSATRFEPEAVSVGFSATRRRLPLAYS